MDKQDDDLLDDLDIDLDLGEILKIHKDELPVENFISSEDTGNDLGIHYLH